MERARGVCRHRCSGIEKECRSLDPPRVELKKDSRTAMDGAVNAIEQPTVNAISHTSRR